MFPFASTKFLLETIFIASTSAQIEFDSATQNMKCPYCDTEYEVETLKSYDDVLNAEQSDKMDWDVSAVS